MAFLEKNEVKTFQWEAEADLLHGAVQQWLKYRQDYLLETFHTVSLTQFIHFPRRWTKHEATLLLRFLYPAKGWLDLDIHSRDNYIWNGHAVCLGSQGREAGTCRARMMLCQRKCQENSSLMASISLQCSVHICIKFILVCSEMGWDKSSSRLPCMWKGEEYLRSSCCCQPLLLLQLIIIVSAVCKHGRRCSTVFVVQMYHLLRDVLVFSCCEPWAGKPYHCLQEVQFSH